MGHIFISYATADAAAAKALCAFLDKRGIKTWIAPRDIPKGASHVDVIPAALQDASDVVLVFSDATNSAIYVNREIDLALALRRRIIPVRLEEAQPAPSLMYLIGGNQWIDAFAEPVDVWRAHVAAMVLDPNPAATKTSRFKPPRNITLSPAMLFLCVIAFLATVIAAVFTTALQNGESTCSAENPLACASDPRALAALFLVLAVLCVLVPRIMRGRRRYLVLEEKDVTALIATAVFVMVAVFLRAWLMGLVTLLYLALFALLRHRLNRLRAAVSVGLLSAAIVVASFGEGAAYRYLMSSSENTLFLFNSRRTADDFPDNEAMHVYDLFRGALQSVQGIAVLPDKKPAGTEFDSLYRERDVRDDLSPLFQRAVLTLRPFNIVLVVDAVAAAGCKDQSIVSVTVTAFAYRLGDPPNWAYGTSNVPAGWHDFTGTMARDAAGRIYNAGQMQALFAAHFIDWVTRSQGGHLDQAARRRLQSTALDLLHFQFANKSCVSGGTDKLAYLCQAENGSEAQMLRTISASLAAFPENLRPKSCGDDQKAARQAADFRSLQLRTE